MRSVAGHDAHGAKCLFQPSLQPKPGSRWQAEVQDAAADLGGGCNGACGRNQQTWINIDNNKPESTNLRPLDPLHVEEIYF